MDRVSCWILTVLLPVLLSLAPETEADATPADITVITQNLYIGADTTPVLMSPDPATIGAAFNSVLANDFRARADAIAGEAAIAGGPLLIGLQEAAIISGPSGTLDYAQILLNQLTAQGLHYAIAGVHTGFQLALGGFSATDREVVLARTDVPNFTVTGAEAHSFVNDAILSTPSGPLPLQRGYVLVNAAIEGMPFQFVSTHLDETHSAAQPLEADEILARLGMSAEPQLVVGDFNSRPDEPTRAELLGAGFTDSGTSLGPTCCQAPDLNNQASPLGMNKRYDYVFERGFSAIDSVALIGDQPFESMRPRWPSDHAGVVATLAFAAVPEPTAASLVVSAMFLLGILKLRNRR
jgi:endonuclease/exonuclease/phosphatase family metal-dependent hydrolase